MKVFITFFDTIQLVGIAETENKFVQKGKAVFKRFEVEIESEDVFEYDAEEIGYNGDLSLTEFLAENGITLTPNQLAVIVEDEVLGTEIELVRVTETAGIDA